MTLLNKLTKYHTSIVPENETIFTYSILAYNNLFDKNGRDATLFDSASPTVKGEGTVIAGLLPTS